MAGSVAPSPKKALAQGRQRPVFTSLLAGALLRHRKDYYSELELASRTLNADRWLVWFADIALEAQDRSCRQVDFMLAKTRLFDRLEGQLNEWQEKALLRMFAEGIDGFRGGLSAKNYMTITGAPTATALRGTFWTWLKRTPWSARANSRRRDIF
ncbi:hypothetical protein [Hyphomonas sp.]|uniref:hypothetical protein n=1 Tax=Hyphomonas sp. TaxID=87 RepID=UPI0025BF77CD|nr:hypothetical protein [Hyphomonas sp.]